MRLRRSFLPVMLACLLLLSPAKAVESGHQSYSYNVYGKSVPCPAPYEIAVGRGRAGPGQGV